MSRDVAARWSETVFRCGGVVEDEALDLLLKADREPHRADHTLQHIEGCRERLDTLAPDLETRGLVELALSFHDVVYGPGADDEAASAELALRWCPGLPAADRHRLRARLLATAHEGPPPSGDAAVLVDVDLGILGAAEGRHLAYETQVRRQFSAVSEAAFRGQLRGAGPAEPGTRASAPRRSALVNCPRAARMRGEGDGSPTTRPAPSGLVDGRRRLSAARGRRGGGGGRRCARPGAGGGPR